MYKSLLNKFVHNNELVTCTKIYRKHVTYTNVLRKNAYIFIYFNYIHVRIFIYLLANWKLMNFFGIHNIAFNWTYWHFENYTVWLLVG